MSKGYHYESERYRATGVRTHSVAHRLLLIISIFIIIIIFTVIFTIIDSKRGLENSLMNDYIFSSYKNTLSMYVYNPNRFNNHI